MIFNSPRLDNNGLHELYNDNYYFFKRSNKAEFVRILNIYRRTIKPLEKKLKSKCVLEIGSAKGYLIALLEKLGWEAFGVELSPLAAEFSRKNFKLNVFTGLLENYVKCTKQKFPVILAIDVIEHVPEPDIFIRNISKLLAADGILILDTPNGESSNIRRDLHKWKGFNPFHIYIFNKDNLSLLLKKHGLICDKVFSYGNYPSNSQSDSHYGRLGKQKKMRDKKIIKKISRHLRKSFRNAINKTSDLLFTKIYLNNAVDRAKSDISYFDSLDSNGLYSQSIKGDNIVTYAKKTSTDEQPAGEF